jgi:hypothetical protein
MRSFTQVVRRWGRGLGLEILAGASRREVDLTNIIRVPPKTIRYKLLGRTIRALRIDGPIPNDWDLDRREVKETTKFISVVQHFTGGVPWENTPIFRRYAARLSKGEVIRGCQTVEDLKEIYRADMDRLYVSLQKEGFLSPVNRHFKKTDLPHVYVGREGEIIFGSDGNHRLAMACILGMSEIPCRVIRRHEDWLEFRRELAGIEAHHRHARVQRILTRHPDLQDLLT